mgnify:FL=1
MSEKVKLTHGAEMNNVYRYTRHVYDISRKYFLFGRDTLISEVASKSGQKICEIGCGTGRNLIKLAQLNSSNQLFGIDASDLMLEIARGKIKRHKLERVVSTSNGLAEEFHFHTSFDVIMFPYSLSMISDQEGAIRNAFKFLNPGGVILILDFGELEGFPLIVGQLFKKFLKRFSVSPRKRELSLFLTREHIPFEIRNLSFGYSYIAEARKN